MAADSTPIAPLLKREETDGSDCENMEVATVFDEPPPEYSSAVNINEESQGLLGDETTEIRNGGATLSRRLTLSHAIGLTIGTVIGSGIFITPNEVLRETGSVGAAFFMWIICGLVSLLGALCFCELSTSIPDAGASYAYMHRAFGGLPAFLYVWTSGFVIRPSERAIGAIALANYLCRPFYTSINATNSTSNETTDFIYADEVNTNVGEPPVWMVKTIASATMISLILFNLVSVRMTGIVQNVSVVFKLLTISVLVVAGIVYIGEGHDEHIEDFFAGTNISISRLARGFYGGLYSYDAWDTLFFASEEVDNAARVIPKAIILSMSIIIVAYMAVNVAYMSLLSATQILNTEIIAVDAIRPILGTSVAIYAMPILVAISMYGSANGDIFSSARQAFSAGRQGSFPSFLSAVHKRRQTPAAAIVFQVVLGFAYLIPGNIQPLLLVAMFASWVFYLACFVALLVLRVREPNLHRPYKVFIGIPIVMVIVSLYLVLAPFFDKPKQSVYAAGTIGVGVPLYFLFVYKHTSPKIFHKISGAFTKFILLICCSTKPEESDNF